MYATKEYRVIQMQKTMALVYPTEEMRRSGLSFQVMDRKITAFYGKLNRFVRNQLEGAGRDGKEPVDWIDDLISQKRSEKFKNLQDER